MRLIRVLKTRLHDGALHRLMQRRRDGATLAKWEQAGRPLPPPPAYKQSLIRDVAKQFAIRVLVETGTFWGGTIAASLGTFETIYSIELSEEFYARAVRRFERHSKVRLRQGDSAIELRRILDELNCPALFWLDAHYSGDGTARADIDTPIMQELRSIAEHFVLGNVLLIDDARLFVGMDGYPTIDGCRDAAAQFWPRHDFTVANDVIAITPAKKNDHARENV